MSEGIGMSRPKSTGEWVLVTPQLAKEYLQHNTNNYRRINHRLVAQYARAMMQGDWQGNGEPIQFDSNGNLVNGQHRLCAISVSGQSIWLYVMRGVEATIFDEGRNRSAQDYAHANGLELSTAQIGIAGKMVGEKESDLNTSSYDRRRAVAYAAEHAEDLRLAYGACRSCKGQRNVVGYVWAGLLVYMRAREGYPLSEASDFCRVANTGLAITGRECSPALVTRNALVDTGRGPRTIVNTDRMSALSLALDDFIKGTPRRYRYIPNAREVVDLWHRIRAMDGIE